VGSFLKKQARKAAAERRGKLAAPSDSQPAAAPVPTTRAGADHA
jgi:branched-chain amino acid transport system permease protein